MSGAFSFWRYETMNKPKTHGFDGERVKRLRENRGWSQRELARKLGVNHTYLGKIERRDNNQSMDILFKLKELFDVSFDYLLGCYDFDEED